MQITVDAETAAKLAEWYRNGRGVLRWENLEIGSSAAREVFTPSDINARPHWRYGNAEFVTPADITVEHATILEAFRGRFRRMYWGAWVQRGTEKRAQRLCKKHNVPETSWVFTYEYPGYVNVEILRSETRPFTEDFKI